MKTSWLSFADTKVVAICLTTSQDKPVDVDRANETISSLVKPSSDQAAREHTHVDLKAPGNKLA
jgi:hypothetical protein